MKNKMNGILGMALAMAMMSEAHSYGVEERPRKFIPNDNDIETKPNKGQFHYWFRKDGTFLSEKKSERMKKEDCVFTCFAINDKNAIKKFKAFVQKLNY